MMDVEERAVELASEELSKMHDSFYIRIRNARNFNELMFIADEVCNFGAYMQEYINSLKSVIA